MKRLLVAAVGLASLAFASASVPAAAADLGPRRMAPVAAPAYLPFNWGGWYAGLNLGGGIGGDVTGIIFGGQIGYNWQVNQIVFGIETDLHYSGQDDTFTAAGGTIVSNELNWFGTFRGRIGIAVWDRWLPYFTGGLAYGGRTIKIGGNSADDTALGWAIGVGVDYAITNQWSARLEYLHISLEEISGTFPGVGLVNAGRLDNDIFRGAINYRFMPY
jgi:outer membrane immunogenic protein